MLGGLLLSSRDEGGSVENFMPISSQGFKVSGLGCCDQDSNTGRSLKAAAPLSCLEGFIMVTPTVQGFTGLRAVPSLDMEW